MTKKRFALAWILSISLTGFSQPTAYDVVKAVDDVYLLKPKFSMYRWVTSNIAVIINAEDVLVVDSGLTPSAAQSAIAEIKKLTTKPVKFLVNTHWHGDHWQGNESFLKAYPGLDIVACEEGYKAIMRNGFLWVNQFYPKYLQMMVTDYQKMLETKKFGDGTAMTEDDLKNCKVGIELVKSDIEEIKNLKPRNATLTFKDKMVLRRGSREIQFHYLGIGNTTGDVVVYLPQEKVLIAGDLVVYPSPYESGSFCKEWVETSKQLQDFDFNYLIPGHGKLQTDGLYLEYLNALFSETLNQINQAFESGKTTADEAKTVVTHESVIAVLSKEPRYAEFIKRLSPSFVSEAIRSSFHQAMLGKL